MPRARHANWLIHVALFFAGVVCSSAAAAPQSMSPAPGATNVSPDTPLRIRFSGPTTLGTSGKIEIHDASDNSVVETIDLAAPRPPLGRGGREGIVRMPTTRAAPTKVRSIGGLNNYNYYPIIITDNEAQIFPAPGTLALNKKYYITIDTGVLFEADRSFEGVNGPTMWQFSTRAEPQKPGAARIIVASDGTGDFCTLQGALDFLPDGNDTPTTIFLKKGTYTELVYVNNKHKITILGEDRKQTKLEYATNDLFNGSASGGGYRRGVFRANRCEDLVLNNLTIRNTTPQTGSQAEAIIFNGSPTARAIVTNVDLFSYQDTLQINGQAFISNCFIEGDVDFMWGTGPCFFENCTARTVRSNAYFTQIRNTPATHGYVYYKCTLEGAPGVTGNFLSRIEPVRFPASEVVFIDCVMTDAVGAVGWRFDGNATEAPNVHFWEFNSHYPDGKPLDVSKRFASSKQLTQPNDAELIKNYSDPAWVLGGWNPRQ